MVRILKFYISKKDAPFLLTIILVTLIAWFRFYDHPIDHESFLYYYFQGKPYGENWIIGEHLFWNYENNFARLLFFILIKIFKDNIYLQVLPFFVFIVLVHSAFYFMVKILTKNTTVSFISALLFSVNAVGSFEMYNHGRYFFERVPQFTAAFLSFAFFVIFLKGKRWFLYFLSLFLFLLSVWMAHFSTLFLSALVFYAFSWILVNWQKQSKSFNWVKTGSLTLPFIIGTYLLIKDSPLGPGFFRPGETLFNFLLRLPSLGKQLAYQIVGFTVPKDVLFFLSHNVWRVPAYSAATKLLVPTLIFYFLSFVYLYRKREVRHIAITAVLFLLAIAILNIYLGRVDFKNEVESSRYFWVPHIFFSIYLGLLIYYVLFLRSFLLRLAAITLVILWIASNAFWITRMERNVQWGYQGIAKSVGYIKQLSKNLGPIKFIGVPTHIQKGPLSFLDIYYVRGRAKMLPSEYIVANIDQFEPNEIIILGYNQNFDQFDKRTFHVVDKKELILNILKKEELDEDRIFKLLYGKI